MHRGFWIESTERGLVLAGPANPPTMDFGLNPQSVDWVPSGTWIHTLILQGQSIIDYN